jgi:hypothetical protein
MHSHIVVAFDHEKAVTPTLMFVGRGIALVCATLVNVFL